MLKRRDGEREMGGERETERKNGQREKEEDRKQKGVDSPCSW